MNYALSELVRLFFVYGFLGWCTEVAFAAFKSGRNDLCHNLSASRFVNEQLGFARHFSMGGVQHQFTQSFANGGAARFTQAQNLAAALLQAARQKRNQQLPLES